MRVSLAMSPKLKPPTHVGEANPLLAPAGPSVVVGSAPSALGLAEPIVPAADTLFGPRGAALAGQGGPLVVADTGHHRLLIWTERPRQDYAPADILIGQPSFCDEGRNALSSPSAATLNVPTGVALNRDGVLAVADAWNHRVLIWSSIPTSNNQPADLVLGQADFSAVMANRGSAVGAETLNWCYGVSFIDDMLCVADTGNRRVLVWTKLPTRNGEPADMVLGQETFSCRDENAGADAGPLGMRWPHGIAKIGNQLLVSDAGNNRVMVWSRLPEEPGVPCDFVLGQGDASSLEHNRGHYLPDSTALNMPYAIATTGEKLIAADTANSRMLGWEHDGLVPCAPATALTGQADFTSKGDNRWQAPVRDSLCWPYGVTAAGDTVVIADSGNNRALLWELAP